MHKASPCRSTSKGASRLRLPRSAKPPSSSRVSRESYSCLRQRSCCPMDPASTIDRILGGESPAPLFREAKGQQGFSAAYFARIQADLASKPQLAGLLASHWRLLQ